MIKPLNILILEDEVMIARSLERIALEYGNVAIALSYKEAEEKLEHYKPDLVLLDINLEDGSKTGIDFASDFKAKYNFEVIFITAYFDDNTFSKASAVAPLNYIVKPFKSGQIRVVLKLIIEQLNKTSLEKHNPLIKELTASEKEVISLVALGFPSKLIAVNLNKSIKTVMNQRNTIIQKLNLSPVNNSLLIWAIEHKTQLV
jgi:DNA-binding NarL/FixJ family response regulator